MDVKKSEKFPLLHFLARQFGRTFGFFGHCRSSLLQCPKNPKVRPNWRVRTLNTLKSFCYFSALDMAPTHAVPGLLFHSNHDYSSMIMITTHDSSLMLYKTCFLSKNAEATNNKLKKTFKKCFEINLLNQIWLYLKCRLQLLDVKLILDH